ncbi:hypothetical protein Taro_001629 [Colocasia esculenta]|uniref:Uncharacterized protein n=1 Tax=Colocasia esculenta TaxID=4460 RepID=A0A843TIM7_COLES|nr:hypothetical protein [Colocasia esculenta]
MDRKKENSAFQQDDTNGFIVSVGEQGSLEAQIDKAQTDDEVIKVDRFIPPNLDSLKDSSSTSSFPAVEVDQKTEGRQDEIEDLGADEIVKEIRNVKRQNNITHGLLSVMIILTAIWQLSEVSILLSLKVKFSHPFKAAGSMISGFLKGGGNLQETGRLTSTSKEAKPIPPIGIPELSRLELPSLNLSGGEDCDLGMLGWEFMAVVARNSYPDRMADAPAVIC